MRNLIILCLSFIIIFTSCTYIDCRERNINIVLTSYDSTESSIVIVKMYSAGSRFSTDGLRNTDTFNSTYIGIQNLYDWEIIVPLAGTTDRITEVEITNKREKRPLMQGGSEKCYTGAKIKLNGVTKESIDSKFTIDKNR